MVAKIIYVSCALLTGKTVKVDLTKPQVISCCFTKPLLPTPPPPPPPHASPPIYAFLGSSQIVPCYTCHLL